MALSLYDATVPTFVQILSGLSGVLSKGEAHCAEKRLSVNDFASARLLVDMMPLNFQVTQTAVHSLGALRAVQKGTFSPDLSPPPETFAALKTKVAETLAALEDFAPDQVNALEGKDMFFEFRDRRLPFTGAKFLLSFSMPNFYFHATTAYDILRHSGVSLAKRDYMGPLQLKT